MSSSRPRGTGTRRLLSVLAKSHDAITEASFVAAAFAAAFLTLVLAWEVIGRYVLERPSGWAPDTASLAFAFITFLAAPKLAWKGAHADMSLVVNKMPAAAAVWFRRFALGLAVCVCGLVAWFGWLELLRVYQRGVTMIAVTPIPKWWLMSAIVYALLSMAVFFLRHLVSTFYESVPAKSASTGKA